MCFMTNSHDCIGYIKWPAEGSFGSDSTLFLLCMVAKHRHTHPHTCSSDSQPQLNSQLKLGSGQLAGDATTNE